MKNTSIKIWAVIALLACGQAAMSQSRTLIREIPNQASRLEQVRIPVNAVQQRMVLLDESALLADDIAIPLFDGKVAYFHRSDDPTEVFKGGWAGQATGGTMGSITVSPTIAGYHVSIFADRSFYRIAPIGNGQHLLVEEDLRNMPKEDCRDLRISPSMRNKIGNTEKSPGDDPIACNIRLLVVYTNAANTWAMNNGFGDAVGLARAAVDATNQSYINSNITFRVELAHVVRTAYAETNFTDDVNRLQDPGDGNMDEIHALRDLYRADLCVLITQGNADCGRAYEIGADAGEAFCAANADCCVGNLSFAHELGHLYGARHDTYVDGSNSPFAFGHGLVQLDEEWRTVMSYNDQCDDNGVFCTRLSYWSNPNVNYPPTNTVMGTAATNNNARVLNETGDDLRAFRTQSNDYVLSATTLGGVTFADVTAVNSIQAGNNYFLDPTATVQFRAGQSIRLSPGFEARPGADFRASIQPVNPCAGGKPAGDSDRDAPVDPALSLRISPNPVSDNLQIAYSLEAEMPVSVLIVNVLGEVVAQPIQHQLQAAGAYTLDFSAAQLPEGVYWCQLRSAEGKKALSSFVVAR